jgi:hypothetical protein
MILQRIAQNSLASLPGKGYVSSLFRAMQTIITIAVYLLRSRPSSKIAMFDPLEFYHLPTILEASDQYYPRIYPPVASS